LSQSYQGTPWMSLPNELDLRVPTACQVRSALVLPKNNQNPKFCQKTRRANASSLF